MQHVNIHEAKTHFSQLVDAAMHGKETVIAKAGVPVAKLVPLRESKPKRRFGALKGKIKIAADFDAPLSEELLNDFEGE